MFTEMMLESAAKMGVELTRKQAEQFERYHEMLVEANSKFNLTCVPDDLREAIDRNYLDCLAPLACGWPEGVRRMIDVGSGAGFPGLPLAIAKPEVRVVLLDSLEKRVKFLQSVIDELGLNAEAVHFRAEDGARRAELRDGFDLAVARAVAPMNLLAEYLLPFVRKGGWMIALKGPNLDEELKDARFAIETLGGRFVRSEEAVIPGRDEWSHRVAYIEKIAPTPEKYPRKAGVPERKPLIVAKCR